MRQLASIRRTAANDVCTFTTFFRTKFSDFQASLEKGDSG
jgi:hypothetical protein